MAPRLPLSRRQNRTKGMPGIDYKSGKFSMRAVGRSRASGDGFVKVFASKATDEVLGVHIVGPRAADLMWKQQWGWNTRPQQKILQEYVMGTQRIQKLLKRLQKLRGMAVH